jgi:hypothetical protein
VIRGALMSKTFKLSNTSRIKEPLFSKDRTKYRAPRNSEKENAETNLLKLDLSRLYNQMNAIDASILENLKYAIGDIGDVDTSVLLDDGLSYLIDGVEIYLDDISVTQDVEIDTISKISGRLSRLLAKVNRLEIGN